MKIDKVSCLCLDKRQELWDPLESDVKACLGEPMERFICGKGENAALSYDHIDIIKPLLAPFNYGKPETINNHYNAFLCHRKMVGRALDEQRENVLLLEDDCYFTNRFKEIWDSSQMQSKLQSLDWDLIYLGWWMVRSDLPGEDRPDLEERWDKNREFGLDEVPRPPFITNEISGLHGLLVNKSAFKVIVNAEYGPIDSYLGQNMNKLKAYYIWPKLIHVGPGWSYCEDSFTKRNVL